MKRPQWPKKLRSKQNSVADEAKASRITNETVAEHREQVLAGGRRFKYPMQYQRHKLVINSVLIAVVALFVLLGVVAYQLYSAKNSSEFIYRITQILPFPVARVDGEFVPYSSYLKRFRSSINFLSKEKQINLNTTDGKRQAEYIQREELTNAEKYAYANKLARTYKVKVSDTEVDNFIRGGLSESTSLQAYERTVLEEFYGWSLSEYKDIVRNRIIKKKVSFAMDKSAKTRIETIEARLKKGDDFATVAKESSEDEQTKALGGDVPSVQLTAQDTSGLVAAAQALEPGAVSGIIEGTDGFYIIKLASKDASSVKYSMIKVKLTAFDEAFTKLQKDKKINEYIKVESPRPAGS